MGLLSLIVRKATRPIRSKVNGVIGEAKVDKKLNPLIFGKVNHKQINNYIIQDEQGKTYQIDHIEIRENGIFCIETKNYSGYVYGNENNTYWTQTFYNGDKFKFYNPVKQNKSHCYHLSKLLDNKYKINSVVVMVGNNSDKINCGNVIDLNELPRFLKDFNNGVNLSIEEIDIIYNKLLKNKINISNKEHVQNIKKTQKDVDKNICPRCGGKLILRNGRQGEFYGCENFPKCRFTKQK
ncbi:MAG: NERD domain-containing protein [Bacillales bacterium]